MNPKIVPFTRLREFKHNGQTIVHAHGVFDVLHVGHLRYLEAAKAFGDFLIVTITTDAHVHKGPGRPFFPAETRAEMVASLGLVDVVAISDHASAVPAILEIEPKFYVKGPDYRDKTKDVTGEIFREEAAVTKNGGQLVFTETEVFSSSTLANKFLLKWSEDQQKTIEMVKNSGGMEEILKAFDEVSRLYMCVVGEPIIDTYRFVEPQGLSSKSPSISARFLYEENYAGGALAIANHLADFVRQVDCCFTHGGERYLKPILPGKMDRRVRVNASLVAAPTPRKIRYIANNGGQRIFECTEVADDQWEKSPSKVFLSDLERSDGAHMVIADFGHGLFEAAVLERIARFPGRSLMVQTNSSNAPFNAYHKHEVNPTDYLCLDTREARVAFHDRKTAPFQLGVKIAAKHSALVGLTLGPNGAYLIDRGYGHFSPAFTDGVLDTTGAGDAYFAITSALLRTTCPRELIPFIGNVFAGLKTKVLGNKASVSKSSLLRSLAAILK